MWLGLTQLIGLTTFSVGEDDSLETVINQALSCLTDTEVRVLIQRETLVTGYLPGVGDRIFEIDFSSTQVNTFILEGDASYDPQIIMNPPQSYQNHESAIRITGNYNSDKNLVIENLSFSYTGPYSGFYGIIAEKGMDSIKLKNCTFDRLHYGFKYYSSQYYLYPVKAITIESCQFTQQADYVCTVPYTILYDIYYQYPEPIYINIINNTFTGRVSLGNIHTGNSIAYVTMEGNDYRYEYSSPDNDRYLSLCSFSSDAHLTFNDNQIVNTTIDAIGFSGSITNNKIYKEHDFNGIIHYLLELSPDNGINGTQHFNIKSNEFYGSDSFAIRYDHYLPGCGTMSVSLENNSFFGNGGVLQSWTSSLYLNGPQMVPSFTNNLVKCTGKTINGHNYFLDIFSVNGQTSIHNPALDNSIIMNNCFFQIEDYNMVNSYYELVSCIVGGEAGIDYDQTNLDYSLIWNDEIRSPLINTGSPIVNGIQTDPDGTPPDIGAVYYPHNHQEYTFPSVWSSGGKIKWMSFPVVDDRTFEQGHHWNELGYMFQDHMDEPPANQIVSASWSYDNYTGEMSYFIEDWLLSDFLATQPKGFKLKFNENITTFDSVIVNGFKADAATVPVELYVGNNNVFENWIGYFVPYKQGAGDAFSRLLPGSIRETYLDHIYKIKAQTWSTSRINDAYDSPWIVDPNRYTLSEGDMVAIMLLPHAPEEMYWKIVPQSEEPRTREAAANFSYTEELDYTPIFIEFDPNDLPDEVGLMVAGECKGAAVVDSTIIEVNYYASAAAKGEDEIEIMFYYGNKGKKKAPDTKVYNPETMLFEDGKLKASQLGDYGYISYSRSEGSPLVPLVTELKQNYPNPFKGITNISWVLEKDEPITVDIYNLKGQKVKSFYSGMGKKGRQVLSWDAKDNNGQTVASGIYFYRLNTPEGSKVQKMMVMK